MAPPPLADQLDLVIPTIRDLEFLEQWCGTAWGGPRRPRLPPGAAAAPPPHAASPARSALYQKRLGVHSAHVPLGLP